jgi:hypothetical protein
LADIKIIKLMLYIPVLVKFAIAQRESFWQTPVHAIIKKNLNEELKLIERNIENSDFETECGEE